MIAAAIALGGCGKSAVQSSYEEPHQTLDDFSLSQNELNTTTWTLRARSALLKEDKKEADLTLPSMDFFKMGKVVTHLRSDTGIVNTETSDLRLSSDVVVTSIEDQSVVKTELLLYSSEQKKFYTEAAVAVTRPGGILHGRGLEANPDLSEIRIFHQTSVIDKEPTQ